MSRVGFQALEAEHLMALAMQPSQHVELGLNRSVYGEAEAHALIESGPAWSARADDGRVLACAGFAETFPGVQATAWAILSAGLGVAHLAITRYARARIAEQPYRRIEMLTPLDRKCVAWARMLGFERDPYPLRNFGAASETCLLFERIN